MPSIGRFVRNTTEGFGRRLTSLKWRLKDPIFPTEALEARICANKYGVYCVPLSGLHRPACRRVFKGEVYEEDTIQFIKRSCGNGDVIHAGTYFGDFLPAISNSLHGDALIWAFEPNRESFRCARVTRELNGLANIELINNALGESSGTLNLLTTDADGVSLGGASHVANVGKEVNAVALDDVISHDRNVTVIQLDLEGFEEFALKGALQLIERCRPIIILEVLEGTSLIESEWFKREIIGLGYFEISPCSGNRVFSARSVVFS